MTNKMYVLEDSNINVKDSLVRLNNDEKLYIELVKMFFQDEIFKKLSIAVKTRDISQIETLIKNLKGMAGNLGFNNVVKIICEIEENSKKDFIDVKSIYDSLILECNAIKKIIDENF